MAKAEGTAWAVDQTRRPWGGSVQRYFTAFSCVCLVCGCVSPLGMFKKADKPAPPPDTMVLGGGIQKASYVADPEVQSKLQEAHQLFKANDYSKAEPLFHKIANTTSNPLPVAEEALYYEAECQRLQENWRTAEGTYKKLLQDFQHGQFTDLANHRLFDIANYWLDDTRKQMESYEEKLEGKRSVVWPQPFVHFERKKPLFDTEGRAMAALEAVRFNDLNGPLGEKALFYLATVKFFRAEYVDADYYYSELYQKFPNSQLASKAIKQSIICKQMATGGSVYDCRGLEEARKLVDVAQRSYPEIANGDQDWLRRQLIGINRNQADRDYKIAEFYRRIGHPGSAYFYFELVRRRYPGTNYAEKAVEQMAQMRERVEQEHTQQRDEARAELTPVPRSWWQFWPVAQRKKDNEPAPPPAP